LNRTSGQSGGEGSDSLRLVCGRQLRICIIGRNYSRKTCRSVSTNIEIANEVKGAGWGGWEIAEVSGGVRNIHARDVSL
jgi:hypothetical protein